ncbi:MAG: vWA domain-containing protein [Promethearchaeota archaeon]
MPKSKESSYREGRAKYFYRKKRKKVSKPAKTFPDKNDSDKKESSPKQKKEISIKSPDQFSEEEQRIFDLGQTAYTQALEYYYFPSLPEPNYIFDYSKTKGFSIDFSNYCVNLNLANTPNIHLDQEYLDYFFSLSLHEIAHYIYCPYDNTTNLRLYAAAIHGKVNKYFAPMVVNIFTDLMIDYRTHLKFPDLMDWELEKTTQEIVFNTKQEELSPLWKVLVRCYEIFWNTSVIPKTIEMDKLDTISKQICKIVKNNYEDESLWEKKVQQIAKLLVEILRDSCTFNPDANMLNSPEMGNDSNGSKSEYNNRTNQKDQQNQGNSGNQIENPFNIPQDVLETFGDIREIKNPDDMKDNKNNQGKGKGNSQVEQRKHGENFRDAIEELASEIDYSTFRDILSLNGFANSMKNMASWYRGQAKNLLQIRIMQRKPSGLIPMYPVVWRMGDPIEEMDPILTMLTSPVIIPNITTRKWHRIEGPGQIIDKQLPDLMLVLDSSGSMGWNFNKKSITGEYHVALMAAFAALYYVIARGSYVSAINFSERFVTQSWTNNYEKIEKVLLSYQGYGTVLPTNKMQKIAHQSDHPAIIMIISDLELENWEFTLESFQDLMKMGHKIISFFIGGDEKEIQTEDFLNLRSMGARFYCVKKVKDLVGMVISEVEEHFSSDNSEIK